MRILIALTIMLMLIGAEHIYVPTPLQPARSGRIRRARRHSARARINRPYLPRCKTAQYLWMHPQTERIRERIDMDEIAQRVTMDLQSIDYLSDRISLQGGRSEIVFNDGIPQWTGSMYAHETWIGAGSLIDTEGPFGSGWPALLLNMATHHLNREAERLTDPENVRTEVRFEIERLCSDWAVEAVDRLDPELTARVRFRLARAINQAASESALAQLRLFGDWVNSPGSTEYMLTAIADWKFDARDLSDADFATVWSYMSLHRGQLPWIEYELEGPWHASDPADMAAVLSNYRQTFNRALGRYRDWDSEEHERLLMLEHGPGPRPADQTPPIKQAVLMPNVNWSGDDTDYLVDDELEEEIEFEEDIYLTGLCTKTVV